jgi:nucleotide sugar dehydrogenase
LVNEMLRFSNDLGVDLWDAIRCAETKPFGFLAFRPGPGVGGQCIPIDPLYLSHRIRAKLGYPFRMLEIAEDINRAAPDYVVQRCWVLLNDAGIAARRARILLVGVTYKPGIADCRESPADVIARQLANLGCEVAYHDPFVPVWNAGTAFELERVADLEAAVGEADVVVLLQPHPQYDLDEIASLAKRLLDTRGVVDPAASSVTRL